MKLGYCYKSERADECPYTIICDREIVELVENWALLQLRNALYGPADKMNEPDPAEIQKAHEIYRKLVDLLKE